MTRKDISEKASTLTAKAVEGKSGDMMIQLITPGWGSSGFYSAAVLEAAGQSGVFPAGTQMFVNHQTGDERNARPEGDLMGLAAVLQEDAKWDGAALVARAKPFQHWAPILTDMAEAIGVSIRASAEISEGEAEGRRGIIVDELVEAQSVDFVTKAGRGGRILEVLESARAVDEALTDTRRAQLQSLVPPHGWVRDYDDAARYLIYAIYDGVTDESKTWKQSYTITNDVASALEGEPTEVVQNTEYVPVSTAGQGTESSKPGITTGTILTDYRPQVTWSNGTGNSGITFTTPARSAGQTTESHQKGTTVQIEDAQYAQLTESAGKVPTLIAERDDLAAKLTKAEADLTEARTAADTAAASVEAERRARDAGKDLPPLAVERVVREAMRAVPLLDGKLDVATFDTAVAETVKAEAEYLAALAPQSVKGFGGSTAQESGKSRPDPWATRNHSGKVA